MALNVLSFVPSYTLNGEHIPEATFILSSLSYHLITEGCGIGLARSASQRPLHSCGIIEDTSADLHCAFSQHGLWDPQQPTRSSQKRRFPDPIPGSEGGVQEDLTICRL